jgi:hypothetical protein
VRRWAATRVARERDRLTRSGEGIAGPAAPIEAMGSIGVRTRDLPGARPIRADAVRRGLPPDALMLDYWLHRGTLSAIGLDRQGARGRSALVGEARLRDRVHAVLFTLRGAAFAGPGERTLAHSPRIELEELAANVLWPMLEGRPLPARLAIVPAGPLARLPWAALPLPDGRLLCQATELVVVPGLRLGTLARPARPATGRPLVLAVDAGELEAVREEGEAVARAFGDAIVLAGTEATADRFFALASRAPWIHFAGHGVFAADAPERSGLRLADRWVEALELERVVTGARWVTLSACQTARALVRPGEEWFGLGRTLLLAGAKAVVASQWDIEDRAAGTLMAAMYRRLGQGLSLPAALAAAQAERLAAGAHPLDWAGFVVLTGPSERAGALTEIAAAGVRNG